MVSLSGVVFVRQSHLKSFCSLSLPLTPPGLPAPLDFLLQLACFYAHKSLQLCWAAEGGELGNRQQRLPPPPVFSTPNCRSRRNFPTLYTTQQNLCPFPARCRLYYRVFSMPAFSSTDSTRETGEIRFHKLRTV